MDTVKLSPERWETLIRGTRPKVGEGVSIPGLQFTRYQVIEPTEIDGITFLPATYVPEISAGEQSAIRAHEYLYGPTRLLGSA